MKRMFLVAVFVLIFGLNSVICNIDSPPGVQAIQNPPLGCHKRVYTYRITQTDDKGNNELCLSNFAQTIGIPDNFCTNFDYLKKKKNT